MAQQEKIKLPEGWINTSVESLIYLNKKHLGFEDDFDCSFVPMAMVPTKFGEPVKYEERKWEKCKKGFTHFIDGDVLLAKITPCFENGKGAIVTGLVNGIGAGSTEYFVLRPIAKGIEKTYLHGLLKTREFLSEGEMNMSGSVGHKRVPKDFLLNYNVPLPPLQEQKRIVEKLDSLLAQVDSIQQRLNNLPNIIKRFRQSVLAAAVSGKLTEQWRVENKVTDVGDSIKEILKDRSVKVTARTKTPQLHLKDEEYSIPDNWKWVSLDSLASKIVDGVHHKPVYTEEGVPFMSVKDIKNGKMTFDFCKYISQETHKEIHPRCNPEKGDLLITKSGTIGRTAIVETDEIFDLFVSVALIKPASSEVNMHFVDLALRKWINGIDISSRVVGTAIKNLHLRDMRVLAIPFAPIEEQTEIVRLVEQYFALADTLEKNLANAKQRVDNLTQSILAKAFRGELVPQDPNDEPADKLLARIKAAQLEAEKLEKASKKAAKASKK